MSCLGVLVSLVTVGFDTWLLFRKFVVFLGLARSWLYDCFGYYLFVADFGLVVICWV